MIYNNFESLKTWQDYFNFKLQLAHDFNVSDCVMEYRFESLKYEIAQYLNGISLENLKIMSKKQQEQMGISVKSLNDIENVLFLEEIKLYKSTRICSEVLQ